VFSDAKRGNHAASGSFLGTSYQQAVDRGLSFPGPGSYDLPCGLVSEATSCARPSTFVRRSRVSCAPMGGAQMTASLAGADLLLLPPGPDFSGPPPTDMDRAASLRGSLTSGFASQEGRFVAFGDVHGRHEPRKFEMRRSVRRPHTSVSVSPPLTLSPWVPGLPHPLPRAATAALRAGGPLGGGVGEAMAFGGWDGGPVSSGFATQPHTRQGSRRDAAPGTPGAPRTAGSGGEPQHSPPRWEQVQAAVASRHGDFAGKAGGGGSEVFAEAVKYAITEKNGGVFGSAPSMGALMRAFSFAGPRASDLRAGFVPPDRHRTQDALQLASPGWARRRVAAARSDDVSHVAELEAFRPPNTTALRFY
jgi:hypothetical protein